MVLSSDEVAQLLNATTCLKHQAALSLAYGAGLRAAALSMLKIADVDSERMLLRVERGKTGTPCCRKTCSCVSGGSLDAARGDALRRLAVCGAACDEDRAG